MLFASPLHIVVGLVVIHWRVTVINIFLRISHEYNLHTLFLNYRRSRVATLVGCDCAELCATVPMMDI
jgi:hypothetical protein